LSIVVESHVVFQFPTEEPITGETLHKAIILDRRADVEKILETSEGKRVLEIPDKFSNLPLMIAVNRNNLELTHSSKNMRVQLKCNQIDFLYE
jgi:hypothetical protein